MTRGKGSIVLMLAGLATAAGAPAWPGQQERTAGEPKGKRAAWLHDLYLRDASEYHFLTDGEKPRELKLRKEPVMRWTSQDDYNGEVYVWTDDGAAAIVGCVFSGPLPGARHIMHEFHSLCADPLHSDRRGGSGWQPREPGITLEPIADAPEPAESPARRLTQMRDLARRFTAQVQRENSKWEMRLLPQPLYRYEISGDRSPVVDGAIFTFVWTAGTDPEVLLVIEARRTDKDVRWKYAPARFTNCEAWLQYRGKETWHAEPSPAGIFDGVTRTRYGAFQVKRVPLPAGE